MRHSLTPRWLLQGLLATFVMLALVSGLSATPGMGPGPAPAAS